MRFASPFDLLMAAAFDLKVGNAVSVNGKSANDVWIASRITVNAKLIRFR